MANLNLIEAIADQMEAEGWQDRSDSDRCAEAVKRYQDVVSGRMPPPWTTQKPKQVEQVEQVEQHAFLRADGQYEMVF